MRSYISAQKDLKTINATLLVINCITRFLYILYVAKMHLKNLPRYCFTIHVFNLTQVLLTFIVMRSNAKNEDNLDTCRGVYTVFLCCNENQNMSLTLVSSTSFY